MTASVNNKSDELIENALRIDSSTNPDEYLKYLNEAVAVDPYNFKPHILLGSFYQKKEQYAEAAESYLQALNIDYKLKDDANEAAKVYLNLGKIYQNLGEKTKSLIYYKDYIGLFPDTPHSNRLAPQIYVKLKNFQNWYSSYKDARVKLDEGKHKEAEKLFKYCLKVNPSFAWSGFYLAKSYIDRGVTASVIDVLKKSLKHREHYCFKYELYKFQFDNSFDLEENLLTELREEAPNFVPGILLEAKKLASVGENDNAAELFKKVVTAMPGTDFAQEALDGLFKIQSIEQPEEPVKEEVVEDVKPVEPPKPKARKGLLHKTPRNIEPKVEEQPKVEEVQEVVTEPEVSSTEEQVVQSNEVVEEVSENVEQPQEESSLASEGFTTTDYQPVTDYNQQADEIFGNQEEVEQEELFTAPLKEEASALEFSSNENVEQLNPASVDPALDFTTAMANEAKLQEEKEAEIRAKIQEESQGIIDEAISKADKITEDAYAEAEVIKETAKKEYEELEQKLRAELAQEREQMLAEKEQMIAEVEAMKTEIKEKAEAEAAEKIEKAEEEAEAIRQQAEEDAEEARKEGQISAQILRKRIEIEERYEELLLKLNKERKTLRLKSLDDAEKIIRVAEKRRDEVISRAEMISAKIEKLSKDADEKYSIIYQTAIDDSCKMIADIRQKAEDEGKHIIELANEERKKILQNANDRAKEILDKGLARTSEVSDDSVNKIVMDYGSIADVARQKIDEFCVELRNSFEMIFNQNVVEIKNKFNLNLDEAIDENGESMRKFSESLKEDLAKTDISDVFSQEEGLDPVPLNLLKDTEPVEDMTVNLSKKLESGSQGEFPPTHNLTEGIYGENESNVLDDFSEPTEEEVNAEIKEKVQNFVGETFDGIDEEDKIKDEISEDVIEESVEEPIEEEQPIEDDIEEAIEEQHVEEEQPIEDIVVEEPPARTTKETVILPRSEIEKQMKQQENISEEPSYKEEAEISEDIPQELEEESLYVDDGSISDEAFEGIPSEFDESEEIPSEDETGEDVEENSIKDIFSSFMDDDNDD